MPRPTITFYGSPFYSGRLGAAPEALVLHIAEGALAGVDSWFRNPAAQVSAHFCVGLMGEIHQYVDLGQAAWANGVIEPGAPAALIGDNAGMNPNRWTVSIEHEGFYPNEPAPAQFEASAQLAAWLFSETLLVSGATGVAVDRKHILRHADISPVTRPHCPGWSDFTLARYIARVQAILSPPPVDIRVQRAYDLLGEVLHD